MHFLGGMATYNFSNSNINMQTLTIFDSRIIHSIRFQCVVMLNEGICWQYCGVYYLLNRKT